MKAADTSGVDAAGDPFEALGRHPVIELRQYTLHPQRRDELITLFEELFVESQDAVGARVLGAFRDLDDPERFVWMRGFASMAARHDALTAFYGGPVWRAHRDGANPTMRDAANVLLLRPAGRASAHRGGNAAGLPGAFLVLIHDLRNVDVDDFVALFEAVAVPMLAAAGAQASAAFVTEPATNTFAALPVRTDERVHVGIARFVGVDALDAGVDTIGPANALRDAAPEALLPAFMRRPERLRLVPTTRSVLR